MSALDLCEWEEIKERIGEEGVVNALNDYIDAYAVYKSALQRYECATNEKEKDLWSAYTKSTKEKKKRWVALQSVLGEDYDE